MLIVSGVRSHWFISENCLHQHNIKTTATQTAANYDELYEMIANDTVCIMLQ